MKEPGKVLVVQTAYLGDTVFTSALAGALGRLWPRASLELCVAPRGRDVALAMPAVSRVHVFDKRGADKGFAGLRRMASVLRERGFDLAVLPHRSPRTALLARLAGIPHRVGFEGPVASFLYTARVPATASGFLEREAHLGAFFGALPSPVLLRPRPEWLEAADRRLGPGGRFAGICLGSEWETKIWPEARMTAFAAMLRDRGLRPVLLGGPKERETAGKISAQVECIDTTGNTVGEALAILSRCAVAAGGDTGLVHAARALGTPTVAIFGPTTPDVHRFGTLERAVSLRLACSPCSVHGGRRCPLGHHRCLRDLDEGLVAAACAEVLG